MRLERQKLAVGKRGPQVHIWQAQNCPLLHIQNMQRLFISDSSRHVWRLLLSMDFPGLVGLQRVCTNTFFFIKNNDSLSSLFLFNQEKQLWCLRNGHYMCLLQKLDTWGKKACWSWTRKCHPGGLDLHWPSTAPYDGTIKSITYPRHIQYRITPWNLIGSTCNWLFLVVTNYASNSLELVQCEILTSLLIHWSIKNAGVLHANITFEQHPTCYLS